MTKVITENFRVENTNELFTSFKNLNATLGTNFSTLLDNFITTGSAATSMTAAQKTSIRGFVDTQLNTLRPEANYYIMGSTVDEVSTISNTQTEKREFQRRVIFGNKVSDTDVRYMFSENEWVTGTIYDDYDDSQDISAINTVVTVKDAQGNYFVYKCLDNNKGAASTSQPVFSNIDLTTYISITNPDGYVWKYLFKVSDADAVIYRTASNLPLPYPSYGDLDVIANAKENVSQVKVESTVAGQFNQFLFGPSTNLTNGSNVTLISEEFTDTTKRFKDVVVSRSSSLILATGNDSYKGMYLKSSSGKLYDVLGSVTISTDRISLRIETTDTVLGQGETATNCQLVIKIKVSQPDIGGTECLAYGVLDTTGTLNKIDFVERGSHYKFATADVVFPPIISEPGTTRLRVIVSPEGGHGFDPITELGMSKLAVLTNFVGESATIPDSNYYTKVGLVKNPTFSTTTVPDSFDNRTEIKFTGHSVVSSYPAGSFITQFIRTVDVRDIVAGGNYIITGLGSNSAPGAAFTTEAMTDSDWTTLGWTEGASGDGSSTPILGSRFTAKNDGGADEVATWQAANPNKRGTVSEAISALTGAPGEETVIAKIHETVLDGSDTKVRLVDYKGGFESKLHFGPIQIKSTLTSTNVTADTINTNDTIVYGSYNEFSGKILHFMDFDPVERTSTRKEKIKFIFDF